MTLNIAGQLPIIAQELDAIAEGLKATGLCDSPVARAATRLHAICRRLDELCANTAADIARHGEMRDALAISERQFRTLAENLPDNIARWDCLGNYLYINPTHERTLLGPAAELLGKRIPASHEHVIAAIAHVVSTGEALPFVRQEAFDEKGEVRVHEVSIIPERDAEGQIVSVLGIGRDVTGRVRIEEALAASERQFRTLAENLPNHLARHTSRAEFIYLNPRLAAFLGKSIFEVAGKTPMQLYPDGWLDEYERKVLETAATGHETQLELAVITEDGTRGVHHIHLVAERDETGAVASVLGIGYDLTGRRRAELDLRKALDLAEGVIAAIPDILLEVDRDGRYLKVWTRNPDLLVESWETLPGKTVWEVLPPQQATVAMEAIVKADKLGVTYGHTIVLDLPDGSRRWFEHSLAKKPGDTPDADTFLVLSRDVSPRKQVEEALDVAHAQMLSVLQTIPDMVWLKDTDGVYRSCNHAFERLVGRQEFDIIGKTDRDLFDAELAGSFRERDLAAIEARCVCINEEWVAYPDNGQPALLETRKVPVLGADGNVTGVLGVARDVTERRRIEEVLAGREREFRTLIEHSPDMVVRYGRDLRRMYINPTLAALVGIEAAGLIGKKPSEQHGGPNAVIYEKKLGEVLSTGKDVEFELNWRAQHGRRYCHLMKMTPEFDAGGKVASVLAVGRDITELQLSREKIHRMACYDQLTTLPNRTLFNERLQEAVDNAAVRSELTGVMMIDIDRFKGVNDTMGHAMGDELLREAGMRLRDSIDGRDTVARLGGDEFAVVLQNIGTRCSLENIASSIIDRFDEGFLLNGKEIFVSCSIGIAQYPIDSFEADDLLKYADSAMYLAKRSGRRGFRFYSKELTAEAATRLSVESALRHAIGRGELELHYQPKVSFHRNEVIGSEALVRWRRPGVGLVPPNEFIPVAEETGLIADLGEWVLREACRAALEWNTRGTGLHKVAVNLSGRQFQGEDLAGLVGQILDETGCRPEWLELEITESLLLDENDATLDTLTRFRSMGLSVAIDDFGTGYSALGYLARFPIDTLKIDRSFVQRVTTDRRHGELVKAILSISRCLGQQVVAEGVETAEQAEFLAAHGCQVAQGFLFSKPLPKPEMTALPRHLELGNSNG